MTAPLSAGPALSRLLVISSAFPPIKAPESAHALYLCQHLAQRGLDVHLLTSRNVRTSGPDIPANLTVHPLMPDWRWVRLPLLAHFVRSLAPVAVLLIYIDWIYQYQPMITFAPTLLKWFLPPGTPFVTQLENENGLSGGPPDSLRARLLCQAAVLLSGKRGVDPSYGTLLRDSTKIIALSERHLDAFELARPGVRARALTIPAPPIMHVCPADNGEVRRRVREKLAIRDEEPVLVYFGFIYPSKGLETLVRAFGRLPARIGLPRLVVVGDHLDADYVESLRRIAREETGAAARIRWTGYCEAEDASHYLRAADLCVLPFDTGVRLNNSSVAVAAAHALPIITTRGETLEPAFEDGENVRLCPPKCPDALARAILELLAGPELRAHLSAGAEHLAREWFSWDNVIDSTLRTLSLADGPSGH